MQPYISPKRGKDEGEDGLFYVAIQVNGLLFLII